MARARTEYQVATDALKLALKRQKLTYRDLAKRLALSESGVKKILSADDGSFQRLAQISRELGLSMRELLEGEDSVLDITYTDKQQDYLLKHSRAFYLYWVLVYEREPLERARKALGLSEREAFSLLRRLDQLELLELLAGGRVRVPPVRPVRWVGGGPLVTKLYREWAAKFISAVASPERKPGEAFAIRYFRASRRTREELIEALRDLESEFARRAIRDMRTEAPELEHLRWVAAVDARSFLA